MENCAVPLFPLPPPETLVIGTVPRLVAPSRKVTVSLKLIEQLPPAVTVVLNVTALPRHEGFLLDVGVLAELLPSVKVVWAITPELWPVAVNSSVAPSSSWSAGTSQVVWMLPSATPSRSPAPPSVTYQGACAPLVVLSNVPSACSTWHCTVSPTAKPLPVMFAVAPGG